MGGGGALRVEAVRNALYGNGTTHCIPTLTLTLTLAPTPTPTPTLILTLTLTLTLILE